MHQYLNYSGPRWRSLWEEDGDEKIFEEIIVENFPNIEKEIVNQVQEAQSPIQDTHKEKHAKTHDNQTNKDQTQRKNVKSSREKQQVTYKGNPMWLAADLSAETLQARREWQDAFKVLKGENLQSRLMCLARISFKIDGEIKWFSDKRKLREFVPPNQLYNKFKRAYIVKKYKRRKRSIKSTPNN